MLQISQFHDNLTGVVGNFVKLFLGQSSEQSSKQLFALHIVNNKVEELYKYPHVVTVREGLIMYGLSTRITKLYVYDDNGEYDMYTDEGTLDEFLDTYLDDLPLTQFEIV
jgi:hypothetical protein